MKRVMRGRWRAKPSSTKAFAWIAALSIMFGCVLFASGCASGENQKPEEDAAASVIDPVEGDEWAAYLPKVVTKEDGTRVQKTPFGTMTDGYFMPKGWNLYNTYALNADNRGCSSCHDLDETLMATLDHWVYCGKYDNEPMRYDDCFGCHEAYGGSLQDFQNYIHRHMEKESFVSMGGTCNSCHYITNDGKYQIWDEVKYDVMRGISDVAANDVDVSVEWNQDEITPVDKMFVQKKAKNNWEWNLVEQAENIRDTYTVKFTGDMDNPREMTIQDMIDEFGTETRVICNQCTINGTGGPLIYQAEVTGIPLNKIIETLGLHDDANMLDAIGVDGYDIPVYSQVAIDSDPLLVVEMNGEELTQAQGYPLSIWMGDGISGGLFTRYLSEIKIAHSDSEGSASNNYNLGVFGDYVYPQTGYPLNTPNIGVLTAETGQIFAAGEPIHLEGYAHAFEEQVTKIEFSFDHGATWVEVPITDSDNAKWVYWKMDIDSFVEPGSYLVELRATSVDANGEEHTNGKIPNFLINVQ